MWKRLRLIFCLIFFVPAFGPLGAFASQDAGERGAWAGLVAGAAVGLSFGLGFGGFRARWFAALFGPPDKAGD
jgi:hypothetical protein